MKFFRPQTIFLVLIFLHFRTHASDSIKECGVSVKTKEHISLKLTQTGAECVGSIKLGYSVPLLEDIQLFKVESISFSEKLNSDQLFRRENGRLVLNELSNIDEPQYRTATISSTTTTLHTKKVNLIIGRQKIKVSFNPYAIWKTKEEINQAAKSYKINKTGLIFDCTYAYVGNKYKTVTISGCIPESTLPQDLSSEKLEEMIRGISFY